VSTHTRWLSGVLAWVVVIAARTLVAQDAGAPSFQAYSKFDFVPGEKVVAMEDFTQVAVGDFPDKWNTDASGEVVTVAGKSGRWLKLTKGGFFTPDFIKELPDNFTLEFDLLVPPTFDGNSLLTVALVGFPDWKTLPDWRTSPTMFQFTVIPAQGEGKSMMEVRDDSTTSVSNQMNTPQLNAKNPIHISVWRQRQRVRVYINQEKAWDVPRGVGTTEKLNRIFLHTGEPEANMEVFLSNIRVAAGAPDTRNRLLTEGKWVSHGILFDVNSDRMRPESYGSLKEIAGVLTENKDLKVQIVGHTDSDGEDAANLDLSKRRAASVKASLTREFAIDAARMDTDGKGESQPVDSNATSTGKANNRRVEFIKR
jgi:outer membrane protein OmpA-like peptidoglycan-associated protein